MGVIEFFVYIIVVVAVAWVTVWLINWFFPGHPAIIDKIVWGVAVVLILFMLGDAIGLWAHDPRIPRLR